MSDSAREFLVVKDNGEHWLMRYTSAGIEWVRTQRSAEPPVQSPIAGPQWQGGGAPILAVAAVADVAARLGLWWEVRQQRLLNEARHEEDRRIPWLADMLSRWGDVHRSGQQLDLRVSEYLAREASETMNAIAANKRVSVPQSMLYELELVQETLRAFRTTLLSQFEALEANGAVDLQAAVRAALPASRLNMDFIRDVARDPAIEWSERLKEKSSDRFDSEFADAFRHTEVFLGRVFASTELVLHTEVTERRHDNLIERVFALVENALPQQRPLESKPIPMERMDAFRELVLLRAEVSRVKALHSAWIATSEIMTSVLGVEARVEIGARGVAVSLDSAPGRLLSVQAASSTSV